MRMEERRYKKIKDIFVLYLSGIAEMKNAKEAYLEKFDRYNKVSIRDGYDTTIEFVNGVDEYIIRWYYVNNRENNTGTLVWEERRSRDVLHGESIGYYSDGQVERTITYKNGKQIGTCRYCVNGTLAENY